MARSPAMGRIKQLTKAIEGVMEESPQTPRQAILDEASELTGTSRNTAYGNPEDNFRNIAGLWNAYWSAKFTNNIPTMFSSADVAMFMILMKSARLATNPNHHDSCVDIAGYAACLGDIQAVATRNECGTVAGSMSTEGLSQFEANLLRKTADLRTTIEKESLQRRK